MTLRKSSGVLVSIACAALVAWPAWSFASDPAPRTESSSCVDFALEQMLAAGGLQPQEIPLAVAVQTLQARGYKINPKLFAYARTKFVAANPIVAAALHDPKADLDTLYYLLPKKYGSISKAVARLTVVEVPHELLGISKADESKIAAQLESQKPVVQTKKEKPQIAAESDEEVDETPSEPTYRPKYPPKRVVLPQREEFLRTTVGKLLVKGAGKGFDPNSWNLLKYQDDPQVAQVLKIVKEDYHGSLYDAYKAAGLDPDSIFQRLSGQFLRPYRIPELAQNLRAIRTRRLKPLANFNLGAAIASEAPPRSRKLRSLIVEALIADDDLNREDVGQLASQLAAHISAELRRDGALMNRVDSSMVLTELRALTKNRTVLEYLNVPTLHYEHPEPDNGYFAPSSGHRESPESPESPESDDEW